MDEALRQTLTILLSVAIALGAACAECDAQTSVVDGDTLKIDGQLIRLYGIDAPEGRQTCDDGMWHPGPEATRALRNLIGNRTVDCRQISYDARNRRPVSRCYAGGDDLQALMVESGWAWAYLAYSREYEAAEQTASAHGLGVHAHRCDKPWEWRAGQRRRN